MFFLKSRTTATVGNAVEGLFKRLRVLGEIPTQIWHDPYSIGWICGYSFAVAELYTNGKIASWSNTEQGEVCNAGWERVTPQDQLMDVMRRYSALMKSGDPDFAKAYGLAVKALLYGMGVQDFLSDPDIAQAKENAKFFLSHGMITGAEREATTKYLHQQFFMHVQSLRGAKGAPQ